MVRGINIKVHNKSSFLPKIFISLYHRLIGTFRKSSTPSQVIIFPGRKLEFELNNCENHKVEHNFMTAVEFSVENLHGKAVALLNLKSDSLKVNEKWLLLPGILLAFILSSDGSLREKGFGGTVNGVGELAEDHNKKGNYDDEKMVKSSGCYSFCGGHGGCSSCGNCGGGGCVGDYHHEKMVKSSGCFGSCGGHGGCSGCSSCSNCGGRCGAEAEECVGNYDHEKMVKSSGCYGPCGGYGGCSSCSNCGGGGCRAEATNEAVAA